MDLIREIEAQLEAWDEREEQIARAEYPSSWEEECGYRRERIRALLARAREEANAEPGPSVATVEHAIATAKMGCPKSIEDIGALARTIMALYAPFLAPAPSSTLRNAAEGIVANIRGGKLPVTLQGVAASLERALRPEEGGAR